jgi:HEPN domain-containing protein
MSRTKNRSEAERWLLTAEEDLKAAEVLFRGGMYAQACFYAQQVGAKALKALWYMLDADPWGHSVQRLILDFPRRSDIPEADTWIEWGAFLDQFYIPTRYPNGLPDLTPGQTYRNEDAQRAIDASLNLLDACKKWMNES